jgi:hypothetical protein
MRPCRAQQHQRDSQVQQRRDHRHHQADAQPLQWARVHQAVHRGHGNAQRRDDDQRTLGTGGEILGLAVPVGVVLVRRARRDAQHREGHHGARQVDQRLDRVRQQPDGPGELVGNALQQHRGDGRCNRQPGETGQGR